MDRVEGSSTLRGSRLVSGSYYTHQVAMGHNRGSLKGDMLLFY